VAVTKEIVSDEKEKPVLNEEILAKLLEAAWVLQEHNRAQQKLDLSLEMHSEQLREREQASRIIPPPSTAPLAEPGPPAAATPPTMPAIISPWPPEPARALAPLALPPPAGSPSSTASEPSEGLSGHR